MSSSSGKRKRSVSLRTQMFNKHLYDKFYKRKDQGIEMEDIQENGGNDSDGNNGNREEDEIYEEYEEELEEDEESNNRSTKPPGTFTRILDGIMNRTREIHSKDGRHIPIILDHDTAEYKHYSSPKWDQLIDERLGVPYCKNRITSSRYTVYTFFPRQIYAQFSKIANAYFFLVAILQMVPGWSTTGTYTTIIPLCVFMSISMAREAWDDFRRHRLDKEENEKEAEVLLKIKVGSRPSSQESALSKSTKTEHARSFASLNVTNQSKSGPNFTQFNNFEMLKERHSVFTEKKQWQNLRVGDFVLLKQDDWVPADMLLLACDGDNNECYVETMALDGETNLKSRQPHLELCKLARSASGLANINTKVTVEDPNIDLYNFEGNLEMRGNQNGSLLKFPLGPENVIYRGSILRNTQNVVGMVIFTGEETKIRMNALKNPRVKAPKLQRILNGIVAFMVLVVACVSFFSYLGHVLVNRKFIDQNQAWYLLQTDAGVAPTIMSFIIMYNTMIPLSLYVTMEIIKVMQSKLMEWDIDMYHAETNTPCESRTATILEELGQVSYIFSDKTGTLTENKMIFRKFSLCGTSWLHDVDPGDEPIKAVTSRVNNDVEVISYDSRGILDQFSLQNDSNDDHSVHGVFAGRKSVEYKGNSTATYTGRPSMKSLYGKGDPTLFSTKTPQTTEGPAPLKTSYELIEYVQKHPQTVFAQKAKFFILSLALCHTCLPKRNENFPEREDAIEYQSSSPDELALVTAARDLGYMVFNRNAQSLTIKTFPNGFEDEPQLDDYEILNYIDFNSQRKRMSVLVKMPNEPDRVLLICKGADNVIFERLSNRDVAFQKLNEVNANTKERKDAEAELIIQQRMSLERLANEDDVINNKLRSSLSSASKGSLSLQAVRKSMSRNANNRHDPEMQIDSIDQFLNTIKRNDDEIGDVINQSRKSLHKQQQEKYGSRKSVDHGQASNGSPHKNVSQHGGVPSYTNSILNYIGDDNLMSNEEFVIERTLQAIDEFSTEGLRTLLYSYKWISTSEYDEWAQRYHKAKTSLTNRKTKIDEVGEEIEEELHLLGATAIEDKLQEGVAESIEKIRRAGIHMWMLTGDKRETAINIGYSCKLIYDYSTVVILTTNDENIVSKMNVITQEIESGNVAHCVIVIDGATLGLFENNPTLMSVFIELCTKTDSVICCRASPSQKALMVSNIRNTRKNLVTLAIGDGANDIAMIQSADIGIGIAGKEGLQASRSSDYSIAQFRFLTKLLFVHGRYNYIRTSKFVLCTFYKEIAFYLTQLIYQRYTMFSGTSLYESWSLSVFNTLFTSLPVLCIGMFEKDLKPVTLLTVPELYTTGRLSQAFNLSIFLQWIILGTCNSLLITFLNVIAWGETSLSDNTLYPLGVVNYTALIFLINIKCQFVETHNRNWLAFTSVIISCIGWLLWCCIIPRLQKAGKIYDVQHGLYETFGNDITFYATVLVLISLPIMVDIVYKTFIVMIRPTDTDIFARLEQRSEVRKKLEFGAYNEMKQGWTWERDPGTFKTYRDRVFSPRSRANSSASSKNESQMENGRTRTNTTSTSDPENITSNKGEWALNNYDNDKYEMLPSGKLIKRQIAEEDIDSNKNGKSKDKRTSIIPKKLRFTLKDNDEEDEEIRAIIEQRMHDLE
ncbi:hypothetical protein HG535_0D01390 [Zygotorulaspora mrakii]|uniref:Phospholipid-transporting ATPase n=1 Tax=Zygotorulaspora mrakii TaxID=42260 RepID=A0A7H9B1C4_ZYGMR|nr:uncharacterized protein HG535_0D01390 [Zygotorulaspora mrakii]QLG72431.1 hypothetical protein HG535_0D01390 [Zygotorulaspora mrakii]